MYYLIWRQLLNLYFWWMDKIDKPKTDIRLKDAWRVFPEESGYEIDGVFFFFFLGDIACIYTNVWCVNLLKSVFFAILMGNRKRLMLKKFKNAGEHIHYITAFMKHYIIMHSLPVTITATSCVVGMLLFVGKFCMNNTFTASILLLKFKAVLNAIKLVATF